MLRQENPCSWTSKSLLKVALIAARPGCLSLPIEIDPACKDLSIPSKVTAKANQIVNKWSRNTDAVIENCSATLSETCSRWRLLVLEQINVSNYERYTTAVRDILGWEKELKHATYDAIKYLAKVKPGQFHDSYASTLNGILHIAAAYERAEQDDYTWNSTFEDLTRLKITPNSSEADLKEANTMIDELAEFFNSNCGISPDLPNCLLPLKIPERKPFWDRYKESYESSNISKTLEYNGVDSSPSVRNIVRLNEDLGLAEEPVKSEKVEITPSRYAHAISAALGNIKQLDVLREEWQAPLRTILSNVYTLQLRANNKTLYGRIVLDLVQLAVEHECYLSDIPEEISSIFQTSMMNLFKLMLEPENLNLDRAQVRVYELAFFTLPLCNHRVLYEPNFILFELKSLWDRLPCRNSTTAYFTINLLKQHPYIMTHDDLKEGSTQYEAPLHKKWRSPFNAFRVKLKKMKQRTCKKFISMHKSSR